MGGGCILFFSFIITIIPKLTNLKKQICYTHPPNIPEMALFIVPDKLSIGRSLGKGLTCYRNYMRIILQYFIKKLQFNSPVILFNSYSAMPHERCAYLGRVKCKFGGNGYSWSLPTNPAVLLRKTWLIDINWVAILLGHHLDYWFGSYLQQFGILDFRNAIF